MDDNQQDLFSTVERRLLMVLILIGAGIALWLSRQ
jgi:hypothetical protein